MRVASVRAFLAAHAPDIAILTVEGSSATVVLAAAALGVEPARIAKTLSLRVGADVLLVVMRGDARLDNAEVKAAFGAKPRFLDANEAQALTGHLFDSVPPAAGATNTALRIAPERLAGLSAATWVELCRIT
ncbi:YbaK/EbsC family protein [Lichenihabitans sp. Uapishka_5]|uniref:YbaK/EbsC family protein n=1 Tax=Lichenihabitans sp. Uapishka_5 TaxID=3037302 RepID=UPI0029E7D7C4|nr:YbaK/EbsC family protein [Lichenihabitans sp. Uapishka_5]MDX7950983.1 YbaK/EbsC family protein [Lichenihabitans sp. Uapishka_5]